MPQVEQELLTLPKHLNSSPVFSGVLVGRSLVFWLVFCRSLFVMIYGFWLVLWFHQTFLTSAEDKCLAEEGYTSNVFLVCIFAYLNLCKAVYNYALISHTCIFTMVNRVKGTFAYWNVLYLIKWCTHGIIVWIISSCL